MNYILIVDDETEIRQSLASILEEEGYLVTSAATAAEALALLADAVYDVVLLDIWLPDRDGLETLGEIRRSDSANVPEVIIISGHGTIEAAVRATKLGAYDFLEKPLSIDRVLHRRHPQRHADHRRHAARGQRRSFARKLERGSQSEIVGETPSR